MVTGVWHRETDRLRREGGREGGDAESKSGKRRRCVHLTFKLVTLVCCLLVSLSMLSPLEVFFPNALLPPSPFDLRAQAAPQHSALRMQTEAESTLYSCQIQQIHFCVYLPFF